MLNITSVKYKSICYLGDNLDLEWPYLNKSYKL